MNLFDFEKVRQFGKLQILRKLPKEQKIAKVRARNYKGLRAIMWFNVETNFGFQEIVVLGKLNCVMNRLIPTQEKPVTLAV